jgi:uncharacterized protein (DUF302 family)
VLGGVGGLPLAITANNKLISMASSKPLDKTCTDLEGAVVAHGFGVMTVHDLKQTMAKKGVEFARECRIYEVCNPHQAKKVMEEDIDVSTALPCRISIYEHNGMTHLVTIRPTEMLSLFQNSAAESVAREIEETMTAIMKDATT